MSTLLSLKSCLAPLGAMDEGFTEQGPQQLACGMRECWNGQMHCHFMALHQMSESISHSCGLMA